MAYLYRHIRLDKNVPFYIGIGSQDDYKRAYTKDSRNNHWNNIVKKTEYEVEIILDDLNWDEACEKETEFIKLYGRKIDGGPLCNYTLGGEGMLGFKFSEESKIKMRESHLGQVSWNKGFPASEERKKKQSASMMGKLAGEKHHQYGKKMPQHVKDKLKEANKNRDPWNKGRRLTPKALAAQNETQRKRRKIVIQYDLNGNFIQEHESLGEAANTLNQSKSAIGNVCNGKYYQNKGFIFKYK